MSRNMEASLLGSCQPNPLRCWKGLCFTTLAPQIRILLVVDQTNYSRVQKLDTPYTSIYVKTTSWTMSVSTTITKHVPASLFFYRATNFLTIQLATESFKNKNIKKYINICQPAHLGPILVAPHFADLPSVLFSESHGRRLGWLSSSLGVFWIQDLFLKRIPCMCGMLMYIMLFHVICHVYVVIGVVNVVVSCLCYIIWIYDVMLCNAM